MTKILNLDALEGTTQKTLRLNGVDHNFKPFTVSEFIDEMKTAEERDKTGEPLAISEFVAQMVKMILRSFPTIKEEELRDLPAERLKIVADFVNDVNQEEAADATPTEKEGGPKKARGKSI